MEGEGWEEAVRRLLKKGAAVRIRPVGSQLSWAVGRIEILSDNLQSVGVMVEGMAWTSDGGMIGPFVPLLVDLTEGTLKGLDNSEYELEAWDGENQTR